MISLQQRPAGGHAAFMRQAGSRTPARDGCSRRPRAGGAREPWGGRLTGRHAQCAHLGAGERRQAGSYVLVGTCPGPVIVGLSFCCRVESLLSTVTPPETLFAIAASHGSRSGFARGVCLSGSERLCCTLSRRVCKEPGVTTAPEPACKAGLTQSFTLTSSCRCWGTGRRNASRILKSFGSCFPSPGLEPRLLRREAPLL